MIRSVRMACLATLACLAGGAAHGDEAPGNNAADPGNVTAPAWLFPQTPAPPNTLPDPQRAVKVAGSQRQYTRVQLADLYSAPDWFPQEHGPMPDIVARGRAPDVYACGYCHTPSGRGRPENAQLAGLPAGYIAQQVADFQSGARRALVAGYLPTEYMIRGAEHASDAEVAEAARYFEQQKPARRVRIVEAASVPHAAPGRWPLLKDAHARSEPLGERLLEYTPDRKRHESRDDHLEYVAYVPKGSLALGAGLALRGDGSRLAACTSCHGEGLRGAALIPPLAGRSPAYLLRQLYAFRLDARSGEMGLAMIPVAKALTPGEMIALAAYAGSLDP